MLKNVVIFFLACAIPSGLFGQYSYELHIIDDLDNLGLVHHPQILRQLDFKGRVYTVRIDETRFTRSGSRWVEGRRNVRYTALFDEKGRLREESHYSATSDLIRRSGFVPNLETGIETYQVARSRAQSLWISTPQINSLGQVVSETITNEGGQNEKRVHTWQGGLLQKSQTPNSTETFVYDKLGFLVSIESSKTGEPVVLRKFNRDPEGRVQSIEWFVDGQLTAQGRLTWNGDTLVSQEFTRDGKQYFVEFSLPDAVGNWQRKVIYEISSNGDKTPLYARYRRIHYYPGS